MDTENTPESAEDEQNEETSEEKLTSGLVKVWTELDRDAEGVSLTVYEKYADGDVVVRDETWWTWSEFTGMKESELHISRGGTTQLDAIQRSNILTTDTILDTIANTDLSLLKFSDVKRAVGGEPIFEDLEFPSDDEVVAELSAVIGDQQASPNPGEPTEQPHADTSGSESSHV